MLRLARALGVLLIAIVPARAHAQDIPLLIFEPRLGYRESTLSFFRESGDSFRQGEFIRGELDYMLSLSLARGDFQEVGGAFLGMGYVRLDFDRQRSILVGEGDLDLGTSVRGFFIYVVPSYLLRVPSPRTGLPAIALGGGLGLAWVRASGTVALYGETSAEPVEQRPVSINRIAPTLYAQVRIGYFLARTGIALFRDGGFDVEASDSLLALVIEIPLGGPRRGNAAARAASF